MRTTHLVPLSTQALAILKQIKQFYGAHDLIFIGDHDSHKPMSENTVNSALRVMGYDTKVRFVVMAFEQWPVVHWSNQVCGLVMLLNVR